MIHSNVKTVFCFAFSILEAKTKLPGQNWVSNVFIFELKIDVAV